MTAPFVPHTKAETAAMLKDLGLAEIDDLFAAIPAAIRLAGGLDLPDQWSEADLNDRLKDLAVRNLPAGRQVPGSLVCFAGAGAYDHEVPAVVRALASRSEFVTAYTPYQPEVAQGVLQALFEYQTLVARLSGLAIANASLYDGAASLVEAANMAAAATRSQVVLCSDGVNPRWRVQLATFARGSGHQISAVPLSGGITDWSKVSPETTAGAIVMATPNYLGCLEDVAAARDVADRTGARLVVCFDPVSAGVLRTPGSLGADIVVGEGQLFGTPLSFGGPYLGLFACRLDDVRRLPGRLVGETVDTHERRAYVTTLRAREQDIRREKASSNVCTNQTLMAVTAASNWDGSGQKGWPRSPCALPGPRADCRDSLLAVEGIEAAADAPVRANSHCACLSSRRRRSSG